MNKYLKKITVKNTEIMAIVSGAFAIVFGFCLMYAASVFDLVNIDHFQLSDMKSATTTAYVTFAVAIVLFGCGLAASIYGIVKSEVEGRKRCIGPVIQFSIMTAAVLLSIPAIIKIKTMMNAMMATGGVFRVGYMQLSGESKVTGVSVFTMVAGLGVLISSIVLLILECKRINREAIQAAAAGREIDMTGSTSGVTRHEKPEDKGDNEVEGNTGSKRKSISKRNKIIAIAVVAAAAVAGILSYVFYFSLEEVDMRTYLTEPEFSGVNGYGEVYRMPGQDFDAISNSTDSAGYEYISHNAQLSDFLSSCKITLSKTDKLSNRDKVEITVAYDKDMARSLGYRVVNDHYTVKVNGLKERYSDPSKISSKVLKNAVDFLDLDSSAGEQVVAMYFGQSKEPSKLDDCLYVYVKNSGDGDGGMFDESHYFTIYRFSPLYKGMTYESNGKYYISGVDVEHGYQDSSSAQFTDDEFASKVGDFWDETGHMTYKKIPESRWK